MRIEAITRRKIVVELSAEDMTNLDITYEALDYASVDTRRVIWVILDRVRECTGCDIDPSGQLRIDAMPRPTGGCILFFTLRGGAADPESLPFGAAQPLEACPRVLRKQEQLLAAFEFAGLDALLDCAGAYARALRGGEEPLFSRSELYFERGGERCRLLVCPAQEPSAPRQFFSEYACPCGEDAFAAQHTREHWRRAGNPGFTFESLGAQPGAAQPKRRAVTAFAPGNVYTVINN
ncbi:MAG: hypothetical protein LBB75_08665 [Oscillospiraceae bacterium]|jgi:hypothetical protein|nr:hypothetical protein [Oscillospiraceae bacterium]